MSAFERVVDALEAHGSPVRNGTARCPAHPDRQPSLSVSQGAKGAVLLCHAGCPTTEVVKAIDLSEADLFDEQRESPRQRSEVVARYRYVDEAGELLFVVNRWEPKSFQQVPASGQRGQGAMDGVRRVLYRLPEVIDAVAKGETVFIVEGEKDADRLARLGIVATTSPGGAEGWNRHGVSDLARKVLAGAEVVIVADRDEAGRHYALDVWNGLDGVAAARTIVEAKIGKDASDHLGAGHDVDEFVVCASDVEPQPGQNDYLRPVDRETGEVLEPVVEAGGDPLTHRFRVNLHTVEQLRALPPPEPLIEGAALDLDSLVILHGPPKAMKSILTTGISLAVSTGTWWQGLKTTKRPVIYVAGEGQSTMVQRIDAWLENERLRTVGALHVLTVPVNLHNPADAAAFAEVAVELEPGLIVFDTLARCAVGADENSAKDMGIVVEQLDNVRRATRACVLVVHHDNRAGSNMRGSSALDGACDTAFAVTKDDATVTMTVALAKNHPDGGRWRFSPKQVGASVVLTKRHGDTEGVLTANVLAMLEALELCQGTDGASSTAWRVAASVTDRTYYRAKGGLVARNLVAEVGSGNRARYLLTAEGTATLDENRHLL